MSGDPRLGGIFNTSKRTIRLPIVLTRCGIPALSSPIFTEVSSKAGYISIPRTRSILKANFGSSMNALRWRSSQRMQAGERVPGPLKSLTFELKASTNECRWLSEVPRMSRNTRSSFYALQTLFIDESLRLRNYIASLLSIPSILGVDACGVTTGGLSFCR